MTLARRGLLLAACASLAGCAGLVVPGPRQSLATAGLPARHELAQVPFHPQTEYQCGPAALATVLEYAGAARTPQQLVEQVYVPARKGSLQPEMLGATRRAARLPYVLAPSLQDLLREVAAGHPVLVLQNLRWDLLPQWHYAVVVGYDLEQGEVVLRSGTERRLLMSLDAFDRSWARAERWAFVALPPDQLPATAAEHAYVATASALERVAPEAGQRAYERALAAWPGNLFARMALGNAAYRRGDLASAQSAYRQATVDHPQAADAWNNLAQVLHELSQPAEAHAAAQRAVSLGGARRAAYQSTVATVACSSAPTSAT